VDGATERAVGYLSDREEASGGVKDPPKRSLDGAPPGSEVNVADAVFGEAAALEARGVQSVGVGVAGSDGFGERKHVAGDGGSSADKDYIVAITQSCATWTYAMISVRFPSHVSPRIFQNLITRLAAASAKCVLLPTNREGFWKSGVL
jgi:hypothetical protein